MRRFFTLWRRELGGYFLSPIAYVMMIFFLVSTGISFFLLVNLLAEGTRDVTVMQTLFGESIFFWIALLISAPILTMRLVAEEKRSGTLEMILTAPVSEATLLLAKYAAAVTFVLLMWAPTLSYAYVLRAFSPGGAPVDLGSMGASYLGALLVSLFFLAVGLFSSTLTRNQIVAAMISFAVLFAFFMFGFLPYVSVVEGVPWLRETAAYLSCVRHMIDFSRGAVDSRPVIFYLSMTWLTLFISVHMLQLRKSK